MKLVFNEKSLKQLRKITQQDQQRIIGKLEYYASFDNPLSFSKTMVRSNLGEFRFRIGDYRVIFEINESNTIRVLKIGHRRDIYK